ncbi:hypothetical protein DFH94DRAFT_342700 [Russula ochroleuca]|uniref:EF-hand domain-containing protein n=1 Tax=Russula ochroleuca TaxID=152965 RepID=A0A9P5JW31_9AGAM|nr:hypothetical protein DFH94DRAFT_342700 [Russula ochroleuca]
MDKDGDGQVSCADLHHAILTDGDMPFSIDAVKYLVRAFDQNGDGVFGFEVFEPLWNSLNEWRRLFDAVDIDGDGRINATELAHTFAQYDLRVSPNTLDNIMKKYGIMPSWERFSRQFDNGCVPPCPHPEMDLECFVCMCSVVRQTCNLYDKCSAGGRSQMSRDEFFKAVTSMPQA